MAGIKIEVAFDEEEIEKAIEKFKAENPDFLEVVRCKDCKYSKPLNINGKYYCTKPKSLYFLNGDDYCSYGERRGE